MGSNAAVHVERSQEGRTQHGFAYGKGQREYIMMHWNSSCVAGSMFRCSALPYVHSVFWGVQELPKPGLRQPGQLPGLTDFGEGYLFLMIST